MTNPSPEPVIKIIYDPTLPGLRCHMCDEVYVLKAPMHAMRLLGTVDSFYEQHQYCHRTHNEPVKQVSA